METVTSAISDTIDSFMGFFGGDDASSKPDSNKKRNFAIFAVIAGLILFILVVVGVYWHNKSGFAGRNTRMTGYSGCCGKAQPTRIQDIEFQASAPESDMFDLEIEHGGGSRIKNFYQPNGYDNMVQGFASREVKPTGNDESGQYDGPFSNEPIVKQKMPTPIFRRPAYDESDFVNMAYSG